MYPKIHINQIFQVQYNIKAQKLDKEHNHVADNRNQLVDRIKEESAAIIQITYFIFNFIN